MSENGTIHISMMKTGSVIYYFFLVKRGLIVYLAALKKGGYWGRTSALSYIGSYTPPPRLDVLAVLYRLHEHKCIHLLFNYLCVCVRTHVCVTSVLLHFVAVVMF